jgi:FkbM family methyltransferase
MDAHRSGHGRRGPPLLLNQYLPAVHVRPYRWRLSGTFLAHFLKAVAKQHHRGLVPTFARLVPQDAVVFDVGAHAGQYTKLFARLAARGRVYAFEPGSYARSILCAVVWLHRLANVSVLPIGLGAASGIATMNLPVKRRGSIGFGLAHLGAPQDRWSAVAQEAVAVTTIDAAAEALALDRLDFVKADIEGWELRMLRGAESSLRRFQPRLLLELSDFHLARAGDKLADAWAFLTELGYRGFTLDAGGELVAVESPGDGDFWFIAAGDPALDLRKQDRPGTLAPGRSKT